MEVGVGERCDESSSFVIDFECKVQLVNLTRWNNVKVFVQFIHIWVRTRVPCNTFYVYTFKTSSTVQYSLRNDHWEIMTKSGTDAAPLNSVQTNGT